MPNLSTQSKHVFVYKLACPAVCLSERFGGARGETLVDSAAATATTAASAPVRRDQTAAPTGQHQQQHDRYHIVDGAHQGAIGEHQKVPGKGCC